MDKKKKRVLVFIICFFLLFVSVSQSNALIGKNLKRAKIFMEAGQYLQAISLLEKAVIENLADAEAHFLLGIAYINDDKFWQADEVFKSAYMLNPDYGYEIGHEYKKIANWSLSIGDYPEASDYFEKAVTFNPKIGYDEGYNFFASLGDTTGNAEYYAQSIIYAQGDNQRQERVAHKILKLSSTNCPGTQCENRKEKVKENISQEASDNVFSAPSIKVVFEKTFTYNDAFENEFGQIRAIKFKKNNIRVDDEIEVIAQLKDGRQFEGKEIGIWMGKNYHQSWVKTKDGYFNEIVRKKPEGSLIISLAKRRDVEVAVKVKRKIIHEPKSSQQLRKI
jgi:tetratricopeptide (TPR) repeat protein